MDDRKLEGKPKRETREKLVADLPAERCVSVKSDHEPCSNGRDTRAKGHGEDRVRGKVLEGHDEDDDRNAGGQHQRQAAHVRRRRAEAADALEVEGQVVDRGEGGADEEEGPHRVELHHPLLHPARRHHGPLACVHLSALKSRGGRHRADEQSDHHGRVPRLRLSAVLHGQDISDDSPQSERRADRVHLQQLLAPARPGGTRRHALEDEDEEG